MKTVYVKSPSNYFYGHRDTTCSFNDESYGDLIKRLRLPSPMREEKNWFSKDFRLAYDLNEIEIIRNFIGEGFTHICIEELQVDQSIKKRLIPLKDYLEIITFNFNYLHV